MDADVSSLRQVYSTPEIFFFLIIIVKTRLSTFYKTILAKDMKLILNVKNIKMNRWLQIKIKELGLPHF